MIHYLCAGKQRVRVGTFLDRHRDALRGVVQVHVYEDALRARRFPVGTTVFADLERLRPSQLEAAARIWSALEASGHPVRLLNHPLRAMRRYELLRTLHDRGSNEFDVYRLTENRVPKRFPVFLRRENDHAGARSELLHTPEELAQAIEALVAGGESRDDKLVVEFCAEPDAEGLFSKRGAFVIGGRVISTQLHASRYWMCKGKNTIRSAEINAREVDFVRENPNQETLREVARIGHIDYGRLDYGIVRGRVQVYEINTHPQLAGAGTGSRGRPSPEKSQAVADALIETFHALDVAVPRGAYVDVDPGERLAARNWLWRVGAAVRWWRS